MHIITEYSVKNAVTGYWSHARMCTMREVEDQIVAVLKSVIDKDGANANELREWISSDLMLDGDKPFPQGEAIVAFRSGHCEGYLIQVLVDVRATQAVQKVFSIKYLSDKNFVHQVVQVLSEAFIEGLFECVPAPDAEQDANILYGLSGPKDPNHPHWDNLKMQRRWDNAHARANALEDKSVKAAQAKFENDDLDIDAFEAVIAAAEATIQVTERNVAEGVA